MSSLFVCPKLPWELIVWLRISRKKDGAQGFQSAHAPSKCAFNRLSCLQASLKKLQCLSRSTRPLKNVGIMQSLQAASGSGWMLCSAQSRPWRGLKYLVAHEHIESALQFLINTKPFLEYFKLLVGMPALPSEYWKTQLAPTPLNADGDHVVYDAQEWA